MSFTAYRKLAVLAIIAGSPSAALAATPDSATSVKAGARTEPAAQHVHPRREAADAGRHHGARASHRHTHRKPPLPERKEQDDD